MRKSELAYTLAIALVVAAAFGLWAFTTGSAPYGMALGAVSAFLFALVMIRTARKTQSDLTTAEPLSPDAALGPRSLRFSRRHPWAYIVGLALAYRLFLYIFAYGVYTAASGYQGDIFETLSTVWLRSDSPSYLGIAENWYVTTGDPRFHIVFFPLYPLVMRPFMLLGMNSFASAMTVNLLLSLACPVLAYELFALDTDRSTSLRAAKYLMLLPGAFFLQAPMTEALFLALTLASLLCLRKRRYLFACIFAALSGFTRSPGILLGIPIAVELIKELIARHKTDDKRTFTRFAVTRALCLLIVPLGLIGYLIVNLTVTGDALTFMTYQREHWNQGFGLFFNTVAYQSKYAVDAITGGEARLLLGLWLPNIAYIFASLLIMLSGAKRQRASYSIYFCGYFLMTVGATWLLSAPRYLSICFPLALSLAFMGKGRAKDTLITVVCFALQCAYLTLYALGYPVY